MDSQLALQGIGDFAGALGLMALLPVAYGATLRRARGPRAEPRARLALGALFGLAASASMVAPVVVQPGLVVDMRIVPIAMAAAFLGLGPALLALAIAALARMGIGGIGAVPGVVGLALTALVGLAWARRWPTRDRGPADLLRLAALAPLHWLGVALLPWEVARPFLLEVVPTVLLAETVGLLLVGLLMERERHLAEGEWRLAWDADRDALTGLLNRRGFERALAARPPGEEGALLLLDLDHFKSVNDRYGHPAGDAVLWAVGARLGARLGSGQVLARLGGEEIGLYLPGAGEEVARRVGDRLCEAVRARPFDLPGGRPLVVTASVGGATGSVDALSPLMALADSALYAAKRGGRDRCLIRPAGADDSWGREEAEPPGAAPADDGAAAWRGEAAPAVARTRPAGPFRHGPLSSAGAAQTLPLRPA